MIRFECPTCHKRLKAPPSGAGREISCPRCGQRLLVPPRCRTRPSLPTPCRLRLLPPVSDPFDFDSSDAAPQEAAPRGRGTSTGLVALGIVLVFVLVGGGVFFFAMRAGVFSGGSGVCAHGLT
jgi:DNA-directed RNA polymerase subunit RPC12/RpoP